MPLFGKEQFSLQWLPAKESTMPRDKIAQDPEYIEVMLDSVDYITYSTVFIHILDSGKLGIAWNIPGVIYKNWHRQYFVKVPQKCMYTILYTYA